jgi:hypothetical protein
MTHNFQIVPLNKQQFTEIMEFSDEQLNSISAKWLVADSDPGYPCRVSLQDAEIGERVLALSYCHHDVNSPYKASGPIFIRQMAQTAQLANNEIPEMLLKRAQSIRAYNSKNLMIDAAIVSGIEIKTKIQELLSNEDVEYLHIHNANPGCYNCAVIRVL